MQRTFSSALLLCPLKYSLFNSFISILSEMAEEVFSIDISEAISTSEAKLNGYIKKIPFSLRRQWVKYYQGKINNYVIHKCNTFKPDLILIYNSSMLLPSTIEILRKKATVLFFLGDSPFYTHQNDYYLPCLTHSDLILSPDTFWAEQLNTLGITQTMYFVPSPDESSYFKLENKEDIISANSSEILYVGSCYLTSWGYKKALLMSKFTGFSFQLYGNRAWKRWFQFFPELESVFNESDFIPVTTLNQMFNAARLIPVDGNPGIINGYHIRLFEVLSAGALPLVEYRHDIKKNLFGKFIGDLPVIYDYNKAKEVATHFLRNDSERQELVSAMFRYIKDEYSPRLNAERIVEKLYLS